MVATEESNTGPKLDIKTLSDRSITFPLDGTLSNISDVKSALSAKESIPAEQIILVSEGRPIEDDASLIANFPTAIQPSTQIKTTTLHWFHMEEVALKLDPIETAKDWDAKNRLRCFVGIYYLRQRKCVEAAPLLTECLATFQETTFMTFKDLVKYTVLAAILVLDRPNLNEKILKSSEVLEVIEQLPELKNLVDSFYLGHYAAFFQALANVETILKDDWVVGKHIGFIVKELRVRAYIQILQSYRSLTIASMAAHFGVTEDFIDKEISRFIAAGRLNCAIDKVAGVVITNPPDRRNSEYQAMMKQGDLLLNKIQKLSRVISQ